jgi:hypothetical protein
MRKSVHLLALTSLMMSFCVTISAQQPQSSADALPLGFNRAYFDDTASAEEVIRRNPDAMKFNENGVLMINGREVHQMVVNGKVVYSQDDTITDPARLLEEIHRRVIENNTPVEPVIAHIDDSELLPDSLLSPYRLPEGESIQDVIRKLPGVEIHDDGTITVNGKKVTRVLVDGPDFSIKDTTVTRDVMDKVNQYESSRKAY